MEHRCYKLDYSNSLLHISLSLVLYLSDLFLPSTTAYDIVSEEYCQWETFNATCPVDHVILILSAQYGRMRISRCVPYDYFVGCSTDVMDRLESRCSGRQSCHVNIPDTEIFRIHPCRKDLVAYLEASYRCVPVSSSASGHIQGCREPIRLSGMTGFIAASSSLRKGLGGPGCPWHIRAAPGQRVKVTLYDFTARRGEGELRGLGEARRLKQDAGGTDWRGEVVDNEACPLLVTFEEKGQIRSLPEKKTPEGRPVQVDGVRKGGSGLEGVHKNKKIRHCPGEEERRLEAYTSLTNQIEVKVLNGSMHDDSTQILIYYEVTGCPDPTDLPEFTWISRTDEWILLGCNQTNEKWHLVCRDQVWVGSYNACSTYKPAAHDLTTEAPTKKVFHVGLFAAIAIGVMIGVLVGFLLLVTIFSCRKSQSPLPCCTAERRFLLVDYENQQNAYKLSHLSQTPPPTQDLYISHPYYPSNLHEGPPHDPYYIPASLLSYHHHHIEDPHGDSHEFPGNLEKPREENMYPVYVWGSGVDSSCESGEDPIPAEYGQCHHGNLHNRSPKYQAKPGENVEINGNGNSPKMVKIDDVIAENGCNKIGIQSNDKISAQFVRFDGVVTDLEGKNQVAQPAIYEHTCNGGNCTKITIDDQNKQNTQTIYRKPEEIQYGAVPIQYGGVMSVHSGDGARRMYREAFIRDTEQHSPDVTRCTDKINIDKSI